MNAIVQAPWWAALLARGTMTVGQLGIPTPAYDYTRTLWYVIDQNSPSTRVYLDADTWTHLCTVCGWPRNPAINDTTHPTCTPEHTPTQPPRDSALAEARQR